MKCPECATTLAQESRASDVLFRCQGCRSAAVPFAALQRLAVPAFFPAFERALAASVDAAAVACPVCRRVMRPITVSQGGLLVQLEACRSCRIVWFEAGELEQVPLRPRLAEDDPQLLAVRRQLAVADVVRNLDASRERLDFGELSWHGKLLALLGLPIEQSPRYGAERPWFTWGLAAALTLAWMVAQLDPAAIVATFGFVPAEPWRGLGVAVVTASFVHADFLHLFGNVYVLLLVGDDVERRFGWRRLALLFLAGTVGGTLLHAGVDPDRHVPLVGASDGLSAVLACYAFAFPWRTLVVPIPALFLLPRLLTARSAGRSGLTSLFLPMPACVAFGLWMGGQLVHAWLQSYGHGSVSAAAHVGGALAGVVLWIAWRGRSSANA